MISIGMVIQNEEALSTLNTLNIEEFDINNMATSAKMMLKEEKISTTAIKKDVASITEIEMETAPAAVIIPPRVEVFENMTMEEFFLSVLASLVATLIAGLVRKWLDSSSLASIGKAPRIGEALISPGVLFL